MPSELLSDRVLLWKVAAVWKFKNCWYFILSPQTQHILNPQLLRKKNRPQPWTSLRSKFIPKFFDFKSVLFTIDLWSANGTNGWFGVRWFGIGNRVPLKYHNPGFIFEDSRIFKPQGPKPLDKKLGIHSEERCLLETMTNPFPKKALFESMIFLFSRWDTVDGRNPAPLVIYEILWQMGYLPYQLV